MTSIPLPADLRGARPLDENASMPVGKTINATSSQSRGPTRAFGRELTNMTAVNNVELLNKPGNCLRRVSLDRAAEDDDKVPSRASEVSTRNLSTSSQMEPCDVADMHNPQAVAEYAADIYEHLKATESKHAAKYGYMAFQPDITDKMRAILIDWLVDVHLRYKLLPETLFLAVNLLDRYLYQVKITRQKLQLVGITALLIAAKYEEIYPPELRDCVYVTDRAYLREEILEMEGKMLSVLQFNITTPSMYRFLVRAAKVAEANQHTFFLAQFICELALVEYKMLRFPPSQIAAAAIFVARALDKNEPWSDALTRSTSYDKGQLAMCAKELLILLTHSKEGNLNAIPRKFSSKAFLEVALGKME